MWRQVDHFEAYHTIGSQMLDREDRERKLPGLGTNCENSRPPKKMKLPANDI